MIDHEWDVIDFDAVGTPFDGFSQDVMGLGGSESQALMVLEGLAAAGLKVLSLNKISSPSIRNGVTYYPYPLGLAVKPKCKTLILQRASPMPENITAERVLIRVEDVYSEDHDVNLPLFDKMPTTLVAVSEWQSAAFPESYKNRRIVYNMIPDELYELEPNRNTPALSFIYASAAIKGLNQTIQAFINIRANKRFENATLAVCCPAYSVPDKLDCPGVAFLGSLPQAKVIEATRQCRNLLHVSVFPETFGIAHVQSEVLGLNLFVHQARGKDALSELCGSKLITDDAAMFNSNLVALVDNAQALKPTTPKHDYRRSKIIPIWLDMVGGSMKQSAAEIQNK